MTLGRSLGRAIVPFLHSCTPVVDDFPDVLIMVRTSLGTLVGPGRFPTAFGAPRLGSDRLRGNLLVSLTLALQELGECRGDFFKGQDSCSRLVRLTGLLSNPLTFLRRHGNQSRDLFFRKIVVPIDSAKLMRNGLFVLCIE